MYIDYPFHFDKSGHTAETDYDDHIRDMIEQLLFTSPGERVNRPDFGAGLLTKTFEPNSIELAAALQPNILMATQTYLGGLIDVNSVTVDVIDSTLSVVLEYVVRHSGVAGTAAIRRRVPV